MSKALLIIITGSPCSGKTTLSRLLNKELDVALISKDGIKEILYDSLGCDDLDWSRKLGDATFHLLFYFIESQISKGNSLLVECPFIPKFHTKSFTELRAKCAFDIFQIVCSADVDVLYQRNVERSQSPDRHPAHRLGPPSHDNMKKAAADNTYGVMELDGTVYEYDTTDFEKVDNEKLIESIKERLNGV